MTLTRTAIRRPVTISMFVVAVALFGLVSLERLALNLLPDISYPSLTIQTNYPDAAPEEIEALVTRRIEEAVGVLPGLTRITSVSRPGQSEVVLEFDWDADMDMASLDAREKLDLIELPRDVEKPVILRFDPTFDPILRLQLYGGLGLARLRYYAEEELQKAVESTAGVAAVKVIGGLEEQIRIEVDEKRLAELGVPITEVTDILRQENLNQASGSLYDLEANYLVRMVNEFRSVDEIERIIIRNEQGRQVVLGDVAHVWRGVKDREIIARLNGEESVELAVYKEGDANAVTVSTAVKERLAEWKRMGRFPPGVNYQIVFDQAEFIELAVENVLSAAALGGLLAIIILYVFLRDVRSTVIIGLSIPISILATFALMYQTGVTLNIMSLGGIALGVGMLVDNSIVVLESIDRHKRRGAPLTEAVYQGTREVGMAVTASTLTTVAVFLPLVFVEGIAGQLFRDQALTITYSLAASLLVAITFIPMALSLGRRSAAGEPPDEDEPADGAASSQGAGWMQTAVRFLLVEAPSVLLADLRRAVRAAGRLLLKAAAPLLSLFEKGYGGVSRTYPRLLEWSLENKPLVLGSAALITVLSAGVALQLGAELIPPLTQGEFSFDMRLPQGKPLEVTDEVMHEVEESVREIPGVATVFTSVGGSNENQFALTELEENAARLSVVMKDRRNKEAERRAIGRIRRLLGTYPGLTYTFERPTLFSFKTPVEVEVYAYGVETQREVSRTVAERLERIPVLSDLQITAELGNPEIQVRFDREKLARLGLEEAQLAGIIRNKIRGEVASRYREGEKQIDILVRVEEGYRDAIEDVRDLVINARASGRGGARAGADSGGGAQGGGSAAGAPGAAGFSRDELAAQNAFGGGQEGQASQPQGPLKPIRLGAVADISVGRGPAEIRRIGSQRAAVVSANLTGRDLSSVSEDIRAALEELRAELPPNANVVLSGQNEEMEASYNSLLFAIGLAVFLVYLVMASQFESLIHPFIILFTVPLAMAGVVLALAVTGTEWSVVVMLGMIVLAGIVVNNAIVLVDYANQLRAQGTAKRQALLEAGQVRLRPIVMTTTTTVLGLTPMALGWGEGAEIRTPMAVAVMGGLLFGTVLTLVFIPVVYELMDRKAYRAAQALTPEAGAPASLPSAPWRTETGGQPADG